MYLNFILNSNTYLIIILCLTSVFGDFLVYYSELHIFRAIFDNATHLIVGAISWFIVCINTKVRPIQTLIEVALCALIASFIDIDHFITAKSFNLKDATKLKDRPILHCTTIPLCTVSILLLLSYMFNSHVLKKSALIVLTAFISHHTRDATRRGFWLFPFNSTPAVPYLMYIALTCTIPYLVILLEKCLTIDSDIQYQSVTVI